MIKLRAASNDVVKKIKEFLRERKMFGTHFIYDGMDFCELVATEEKQVDNMLL